jgi:ElaA protein
MEVLGLELHIKSFNELTNAELYEILRAREEIFSMELGMHCRDLDGVDLRATHYFLTEDGRLLAYLRAFADDMDPSRVIIGRVLTLTHGKGHGRELLSKSLPALKAKHACKAIVAHAQVQAAPFYEKLGFGIVSKEYMEENVPHVTVEYPAP